MSDLLNQASLVMVPSGYKEDTVYSVVPSDGSGDLSFTRASNGTRVNSAGLVEVCPWNLVGYSEDFSNAAWVKEFSTITANSTTAPNGTLTAETITDDTSTNQHLARQVITTGAGSHTLSVYAKANTLSHAWIQYYDGISAQESGIFNLTNGTTGGAGTITSVGDGWYRLSLSVTTLANSGNFYINTSNGTNKVYAGTGKSIFIWGYQLNIGSTAKPYFPTTDRLNVPRLTYQNGGGGCPSLLLEKQSTNLAIYSEQFDNAGWNATNLTISANAVISPDGTQNADNAVTVSNNSGFGRSFSISANTETYTQSIYVKWVSGYETFMIRTALVGGTSVAGFTIINCKTGVVISSDTTNKIESVGNGWFRISQQVANNGTNTTYIYQIYNTADTAQTQTISLWGAQAELSSYPTSYIPTTSSSATRVADACFKTGISSLIGQTEGTLFADIDFKANTGEVGIIMEITSGAGTQRVLIYYSSTTILCYANTGVFSYSQTTSERLKIAFAYKSGDSALYVNGIQKAVSSASLSYSSLSQLNIGSNFTNDQPTNSPTNQAILFKTRLTNAELASLTTI